MSISITVFSVLGVLRFFLCFLTPFSVPGKNTNNIFYNLYRFCKIVQNNFETQYTILKHQQQKKITQYPNMNKKNIFF